MKVDRGVVLSSSAIELSSYPAVRVRTRFPLIEIGFSQKEKRSGGLDCMSLFLLKNYQAIKPDERLAMRGE